MTNNLYIQALNSKAFASFGDVLDVSGQPDKIINQGLCQRYHDRAEIDFSNGRSGISLFKAEPRNLPYKLDMMERHPLGSQAFIPMTYAAFLNTVAQDENNTPAHPIAFLSEPGQAINFHRNIWHGALTPLQGSGLFAVIDRIGPEANLEEVFFETPYWVFQENK